MHPSNYLPEWEQSERKDSTELIIADVQTIPSETRKQKESAVINQKGNTPKSDKQKMVGHRMRFLIGEENGRIHRVRTKPPALRNFARDSLRRVG